MSKIRFLTLVSLVFLAQACTEWIRPELTPIPPPPAGWPLTQDLPEANDCADISGWFSLVPEYTESTDGVTWSARKQGDDLEWFSHFASYRAKKLTNSHASKQDRIRLDKFRDSVLVSVAASGVLITKNRKRYSDEIVEAKYTDAPADFECKGNRIIVLDEHISGYSDSGSKNLLKYHEVYPTDKGLVAYQQIIDKGQVTHRYLIFGSLVM